MRYSNRKCGMNEYIMHGKQSKTAGTRAVVELRIIHLTGLDIPAERFGAVKAFGSFRSSQAVWFVIFMANLALLSLSVRMALHGYSLPLHRCGPRMGKQCCASLKTWGLEKNLLHLYPGSFSVSSLTQSIVASELVRQQDPKLNLLGKGNKILQRKLPTASLRYGERRSRANACHDVIRGFRNITNSLVGCACDKGSSRGLLTKAADNLEKFKEQMIKKRSRFSSNAPEAISKEIILDITILFYVLIYDLLHSLVWTGCAAKLPNANMITIARSEDFWRDSREDLQKEIPVPDPSR
ncbi:hypothetical protein VNO77_19502 [Canavalia gladiata]|uniref:Uncharacterized protein n=1 Tax=Canavalia gladiata TaxID=3824 RepID=A0AAN9QPN9_CANGL